MTRPLASLALATLTLVPGLATAAQQATVGAAAQAAAPCVIQRSGGVLDGPGLPRGECQVSATVLGLNSGSLRVMAGTVDLTKAPLKSDGVTPLPAMMVMPAAAPAGR